MSKTIEETGLPQQKDVHRDNIRVAETIGDILRKSLGPTGAKKLLVDSLGYYVVSSDGAKMLESMSLWHPVAKIIINMATVQKKKMGDGSISAVLLASELLKRAGILMDQGIHPTRIISGYEKASKKAQRILDEIAVQADVVDREMLRKIAYTSLSSKFGETDSRVLADMAVSAIKQIEIVGSVPIPDLDQIHIVKKSSGSISDSRMAEGIVIDESVIHPEMPKHVKEARIAVLACPLGIEKFEHLPPSMKSEILITAPGEMKSFVDHEYQTRAGLADKIRSSGANVVVCEKRIDDTMKYLLARQGTMAITLWRFSAKEAHLERICNACGASMVRNLEDLKEGDLGYAESVEEREIGDGKVVFIEGCRNPKSISLMIRGVSNEFVDDAERSMMGALHSLASLFQCNRIVAGGGSVQLELRKRIVDYSLEFDGKEQLAVGAFGEALGSIPETLIGSVGLNRLDYMPLLISKHHEPGNAWHGFDVFGRRAADMMEAGVVEPLSVCKQAIVSASETAIMILRADAIIAKRTSEEGKLPDDATGRKLPGFMPARHQPEFKDWEKQHTVF